MEKQYSIHEVADLLGVSTDAIRLYEKEKLVKPERNPNNGYRYYNFEQIQRIMGICLYRQLGVSISEIRLLVENQSFEEVDAQLGTFLEANEKEIVRLQNIVERIKFMRGHLISLQTGLDVPSVKELPDCYVLHHQDSAALRYKFMQQIITSPIFPFGNLCLGIRESSGGMYSSRNLEFIVRNPMFDLTPWKKESDQLPFREKCRCIYMVVRSSEAERQEWNLGRMLEFAEKQGLKCSSEGYAFYVFSLAKAEEIDNYFEIYLPIV